MEEIKELIIDHAKKAVISGILMKNDSIAVKDTTKLLITVPGADLTKLSDKDIIVIDLESKAIETVKSYILYKKLFKAYPAKQAAVFASTQYILTAAKAGRTINPMLDDMAQIVGINVKTVKNSRLGLAISKMKGRNAVILKKEGALCADGTLDDALASAMVLEKACRTQIESVFIGGGIRINKIESGLMRLVYLKKYSKQATLNK